MKFETPHLIIGVVIMLLAAGAYYMSASEAKDISLTVDGIGSRDTAFLGIGTDLYDPQSKTVSPGQSLSIGVAVFTDDVEEEFYAIVEIDGKEIWRSPAHIVVPPWSWHDWYFTYKAPMTPGEYKFLATSFDVTEEFGVGVDDYDSFIINVVEATPTPTPGPTATPTETATPTPTATPDACVGVSCDDYCAGTMLYTSGVCVNGQCDYQTQPNSEQCGGTEPTAVPTVSPTATETPTDDKDDDEDDLSGILLYGSGLIGILVVVLLALRAKR